MRRTSDGRILGEYQSQSLWERTPPNGLLTQDLMWIYFVGFGNLGMTEDRMNRLALIWGVAGLALGASGCANRPPAVELAVVAREFEFAPSTIEAPAGSAVTLTLQNLGQLEHDLTIQEIPMETVSIASTPMAGHEMADAEQAPQLHVGTLVTLA